MRIAGARNDCWHNKVLIHTLAVYMNEDLILHLMTFDCVSFKIFTSFITSSEHSLQVGRLLPNGDCHSWHKVHRLQSSLEGGM